MLGHAQSQAVEGSFRNFYVRQIERAKRLNSMPGDIAVVVTLRSKTLAAIARVFQAYAAFFSALLMRGMHAMKRRVLLDTADQHGPYVELEDIDARIDKAVVDFKAYEEGNAAHQRLHVQPVNAGTSNATLPALAVPVAVMAASSPVPQPLTPAIVPLDVTSLKNWPDGVYAGWGDQAVRHGVFVSDWGPVYGRRLVTFKKTITFRPNTCIAAAGPNAPGKSNSKWCVNPKHCAQIGYLAHEHPAGVSSADLEVRLLSDDELAKLSKTWKVVVEPQLSLLKETAPRPPWASHAGPANGDAKYETTGGAPTDTTPRRVSEETPRGGAKGRRGGRGKVSGRAGKRARSFEGQFGAVGEPSGAFGILYAYIYIYIPFTINARTPRAVYSRVNHCFFAPGDAYNSPLGTRTPRAVLFFM